MKKFLVNSFLFSVIILLIVFVVGMMPVSDEYIIQKTANTSFEKIAWNLDFVKHHPEQISGKHVFMGSSLMLAGLSDSILNASGIPAINFGINGTGHEVILYFLERILPHKPAKVYLHFYKFDKKGLHSMTPLLYDPVSLLKIGQSISMDFIKFLFKRVYYVMDYELWKLSSNKLQDFKFPKYGSVYREEVFTEENYKAIKKETTDIYFESFTLHQNNFIRTNEKGKSGLAFATRRLIRALLFSYSNSEFIFNCRSQSRFATRSMEICKENNLEPYRLYIPMVTDTKIDKDFDETFYVPRNGNKNIISLPNFAFLDSAAYWADMSHMSRAGADVFTQQLSPLILQ